MSSSTRYSKVAMALHWLIALVIIGLITFGHLMTNENVPNRFVIYQWHKSFGMLVLFLSLFRLFWRLGHKPPALPMGMKGWEITASKVTHIGFYVLMIGMPLLGWAMATASKFPPQKFFFTLPWVGMPFVPVGAKDLEVLLKSWHAFGGKVILALIVLHIGAALKHQFVSHDNLLARMLPFMKSNEQRGV